MFELGAGGKLEAVNGVVGLYDKWTGHLINKVEVGALPDMIACTPDGNTLLVANEGEPEHDNYDPDPEGSVSIIDVSNGAKDATVTTAGFGDFNGLKKAMLAPLGRGRYPLGKIMQGNGADQQLLISIPSAWTGGHLLVPSGNGVIHLVGLMQSRRNQQVPTLTPSLSLKGEGISE